MIRALSAWYFASCMIRRAMSGSGGPTRVYPPRPSSNRPFTAFMAIVSVVTRALELSSASASLANSASLKPWARISDRSGTVRPSGRAATPLRTSRRCQYCFS